jgi:hypothetical protein
MSLRPGTAATTTLVAAIVVTVGNHLTAGSLSVSRTPLHVLLTISSDLAPLSRQTLISETERIWHREQVDIDWTRPGYPVEPSEAPLRVLVVARPQSSPAGRRWPVAELIVEATPRAVAIASIEGAERVVNEATRSGITGHTTREYQVGLVLGRAVAHEIGHFLLSTGTHADSGLMRAIIDAREFTALNGDAFRLDRDASRWLRQRRTTTLTPLTIVRERGFSYRGPAGH